MKKIVYVTKVVPPDVPSGAFLPSTHPTLSVKRFITQGGNLGCSLSADQVRCNIITRSWTPPSQPSSCTAAWGNALVLGHLGPPEFACGGPTAPPTQAPVVPDGWDDVVDGFTCQVRVFGVDCFRVDDGRGMLISRTGYTIY